MTVNFSAKHEAIFWQSPAIDTLSGVYRGLEKESLRINQQGKIALTPHPTMLGSALTNRFITTDYSEALLEFITPPTDGLNEPLEYLQKIHQFVYRHLQQETLWASSMPCVMGNDNDIPIAQYGSSNSGKMKTVYRHGLGLRYGRFMQTISGVHYNFSFSDELFRSLYEYSDKQQSFQDFKSERYFGVIRNFLRNAWMLPLLFGASPAVCETFLKDRSSDLEELVPGTRYGKYSTSLRMSDLGYQNNAQSSLKVSCNSLNEYVRDLEHAIRTEDRYYKEIGVKTGGEYQQLNANLLQIENEFYSYIRPKRTTQSGERPTKALDSRGVEYIEIRTLDIDPFSPTGISQLQLNFLDVFMLHCLIKPSQPINDREEAENSNNFCRIVNRGREPGLKLIKNNRDRCMIDWANALFKEFKQVSKLYDSAYKTSDFSDAVNRCEPIIAHPELSPSSKMIQQIQSSEHGFFQVTSDISDTYADYYNNAPVDQVAMDEFVEEARQSIERQKQIEQLDNKSFEQFLQDYFN